MATTLQDNVDDSKTTWLSRIGPFVLVFSVGLIAYCNSTNGVFLLDDHPHIIDNPTIRSLEPASKFIFQGGLRKLPTVSLAVNYALGGLDPVGYHYFNVAIHLLAGLCLYELLRLTFSASVWTELVRSNTTLLAMIVACVWIAHPLNTQAVNYIIQRSESMMALSAILFLLLYAKSARTRFAKVYLVLAWCVFCAGLACKEVMVMSLPIALLYDRAFLTKSWREAMQARWKFWLACAAPLALAGSVIVPAMLGSESAVGLQLQSVSPSQYLRTQPEVILHYFRLALVPWPQVFDYGWPVEERFSVIAVTSGVLLCGITFLIWLYTRKPQLAFWGLAPLLVLFPTTSFVPLQDLAVEHRMYLPLMFVIVAVVLGIISLASRLFHARPVLLASAICAVWFIGLGILTLKRNQVYNSEIVMWQDVVNKTVGAGHKNSLAGRAYSNLGDALGDAEQWDKSIEALKSALQYKQFANKVHANLARAFVATGKIELAKVHCQKALEVEPNSARLRQQAGLIHTMQGNFEEAEKSFRSALEVDSADTVIIVNLAQCLLQLKKVEEAESLFRHAIDLDARYAEPRRRLVESLMRKSDWKSAATEAIAYTKYLPNDPRANLQLGTILAARKEFPQAIEQLEIAASFDPPPPEANLLLGNVWRSQKKSTEAIRRYEVELKHFPKNADALNAMAELVAKDNPRLSVSYFQRVIDLTPGYWQARYNIASLHAMLGSKEAAREQLLVVLKINPEFVPATELLKSLE